MPWRQVWTLFTDLLLPLALAFLGMQVYLGMTSVVFPPDDPVQDWMLDQEGRHNGTCTALCATWPEWSRATLRLLRSPWFWTPTSCTLEPSLVTRALRDADAWIRAASVVTAEERALDANGMEAIEAINGAYVFAAWVVRGWLRTLVAVPEFLFIVITYHPIEATAMAEAKMSPSLIQWGVGVLLLYLVMAGVLYNAHPVTPVVFHMALPPPPPIRPPRRPPTEPGHERTV